MSPGRNPLRLLCVHQGFELYGSDRTFVQSLRALRKRFPDAEITALLPRQGPLQAAVEPVVDRLETTDLFVLRRSELKQAGPALLGRLIRSVRRAAARIRQHDLTYVNTIVLLDFILASRLARRPVLIHVHELPLGIERFAFSAVLACSRARLLFNSQATRNTFVLPPWRATDVVHNGTPGPGRVPVPPAGPRPDRSLHLLMLGRFSSWKGQSLLVEALGRLTAEEQASVRLRLVGDAFVGQEHYVTDVQERIERLGLRQTVSVLPFVDDPGGLYAWADLVVVPSLKPEPFGLVAIEAMSFGRPVVGAAHGGLCEIVEDGSTGRLFRPGDPDALAAAIRDYAQHPERLDQAGRAAQRRFVERFEEQVYLSAVGRIAAEALGAAGPPVATQLNETTEPKTGSRPC